MPSENKEVMTMLRAIANGQSALRQEMLAGFKRLDENDKRLEKKIDDVEVRLTSRIDKLGYQLAELSDDTPTKAEFDSLEKRVRKVERKVFTN